MEKWQKVQKMLTKWIINDLKEYNQSKPKDQQIDYKTYLLYTEILNAKTKEELEKVCFDLENKDQPLIELYKNFLKVL